MDEPRDDRPDALGLGDLLRRGGQQRVDRAKARGQAAARDVADALDADGEQDDAERPVLGGMFGCE
jgi:hypothetical protein